MRILFEVALGVTLAAGGLAAAQEYPGARPIRILTSQAGSGSEVIARIVSDKLPGTSFGQRSIVDNRGILAPEIAAKAAPDGYTVLFYSTPMWVSPSHLAAELFNSMAGAGDRGGERPSSTC